MSCISHWFTMTWLQKTTCDACSSLCNTSNHFIIAFLIYQGWTAALVCEEMIGHSFWVHINFCLIKRNFSLASCLFLLTVRTNSCLFFLFTFHANPALLWCPPPFRQRIGTFFSSKQINRFCFQFFLLLRFICSCVFLFGWLMVMMMIVVVFILCAV